MDCHEAKEANFTFSFARKENYLLEPVILSFSCFNKHLVNRAKQSGVFQNKLWFWDPSLLLSPMEPAQGMLLSQFVVMKQRRAGLLRNASDAEAKPLSPVYLSVFADCLGYKLQGWLCCPFLSQGGILLHNQRSALHLQLRASVRFFITNISQGLGSCPLPLTTCNFIRSVHPFMCSVGGNGPQNKEGGTPLSNQLFLARWGLCCGQKAVALIERVKFKTLKWKY